MRTVLLWFWDGTGLAADSAFHCDDTHFQYGIVETQRGRKGFLIVGDTEVIGRRKKFFKTLRGAISFCENQEDAMKKDSK